MRHLYGHALEEFPRMRQQAIDQRKGALRLFDDHGIRRRGGGVLLRATVATLRRRVMVRPPDWRLHQDAILHVPRSQNGSHPPWIAMGSSGRRWSRRP